MNQKEEEEVVYVNEKATHPSMIIMIVLFIWALLGLLAFITSIVCFAYDGSFMQNWVGFLTSMILGPFYWIYYLYVDPSYCSKSGGRKQQFQKKFIKKSKSGKKL